MRGPVPNDLLRRLSAVQAMLDHLVLESHLEGFEVEIHAALTETGTAYSIALVRRIYAPAPDSPDLKVI